MKSILLIIPEFGSVSETLKTYISENYQTQTITIDEKVHLRKNKILRSVLSSFYYKIPLFLRNIKRLNKIVYPISIEKDFFKTTYDYFIVIKGHGINPKDLTKVKSQVKILYMWDKIIRFPLTSALLPIFDLIYSYDITDSKNYGLIHLPMYVPLYENTNVKSEKQFYVSFIGEYTAHRFQIVKNVRNHCLKNNFTFFLKLIDINQKTTEKDSIITTKKIGHNKFVDVISKSYFTMDLSRNGEDCITERSTYASYFGIPLIHEGNGDLVNFFNNPKLILPPKHHVYDINEWSNFILS